jgi:hypothetical protein
MEDCSLNWISLGCSRRLKNNKNKFCECSEYHDGAWNPRCVIGIETASFMNRQANPVWIGAKSGVAIWA